MCKSIALGISSLKAIKSDDYIYVDKTKAIAILEELKIRVPVFYAQEDLANHCYAIL